MSAPETDKLRNLLSTFEVGQLTTIDDHYRLVSRPMLPLYSEFDGRLWFFAKPDSRVVSHITHRASANVTFASSKAWLSFAGTADLNRDPDLAESLWTTELEPWFSGGLDLDAACLVQFTAEEARFWHSPSAMETLVSLVAPRSRPTATRPRTAGIQLP
ncbi:MAG: pyridoxamine 5'-phosphate oxidase family protein [Rhodococcus sp. (in: high G+C Gram-positive bacteria)]|uniref:pyridoxamine 5'-phosphate oxidase family protein n=1 Tax=Rhodococcus sp. TaxID=1831 RepID=UPI002AD669F5|nr:pyridoxamine 5'-phosphate oxidase family protein [Rhodococcus sp. (in: high G+C Gram-positive bacteria)]MDZ7930673.1 pyridoxamine 5'-phosphate oxidase family protein [Rhodococcus sp. (in: high G+C Gram-positive bacteria)]